MVGAEVQEAVRNHSCVQTLFPLAHHHLSSQRHTLFQQGNGIESRKFFQAGVNKVIDPSCGIRVCLSVCTQSVVFQAMGQGHKPTLCSRSQLVRMSIKYKARIRAWCQTQMRYHRSTAGTHKKGDSSLEQQIKPKQLRYHTTRLVSVTDVGTENKPEM